METEEKRGEQGRGKRREKRRDEGERKREGETATLGLPHLWAYHLLRRRKITVPVPEGLE